MKEHDISELLDFLPCRTPGAWIRQARLPENLPTLLADHANLEQKAAQSAMTTIRRYAHGIPGIAHSASNPVRRNAEGSEQKAAGVADGQHPLLNKLSRLAREELRHFEQVIAIMKRRGVDYPQISASRYAAGLHKQVRSAEPGRLVDTLLVGAIIEARSCERFAVLAPELDEELRDFYLSLLKSESRHFMDYLKLARSISSAEEVDERLAVLLEVERDLIESPDTEFRFHSGVP